MLNRCRVTSVCFHVMRPDVHAMEFRLGLLGIIFAGSLHGLLCPVERVERHNPLRLLPDYDVTWQQNAQHG